MSDTLFSPERLPPPDEYGFFVHPDLPCDDEDEDVGGFDIAFVGMEYDAPGLADEYVDDEDMTAPTRWTPTPPKGDGWMLAAKYDTEDGPYALFVRPRVEEQQT